MDHIHKQRERMRFWEQDEGGGGKKESMSVTDTELTPKYREGSDLVWFVEGTEGAKGT